MINLLRHQIRLRALHCSCTFSTMQWTLKKQQITKTHWPFFQAQQAEAWAFNFQIQTTGAFVFSIQTDNWFQRKRLTNRISFNWIFKIWILDCILFRRWMVRGEFIRRWWWKNEELRNGKIEDFIPPDSYRDRNSYLVIGTAFPRANIDLKIVMKSLI